MTAVGIDLGTTYSCAFHHTSAGEDILVRSFHGGELTPSVVYFDPDGSVLVGDGAKKLLKVDPENVVVGIKRHMGEDHPLEFHGREYTPEAISGLILKRIALDAAAQFGVGPAQLRCVITVPAYFGVAEKEATYAAARIADLNCVEILAEPVAAAYAYGADPNADESSLVFDLGGGTFDVAVVGLVDRRPRTWAVDGETQLGGLDWDHRLSDLLWDGLAAQHVDEDAIFDEEFSAMLLTESELLKRMLSSHESGTVRLRHGGRVHPVTISRDIFESATTDLVAQCIDATRRVIDTAKGLGARDISRVLLVGGSTRMPMIRTALETQLRLPVLIHDPDKAVARGAAILANRIGSSAGTVAARVGGMTAERITHVLPKAIGIKTYSSDLPLRPDPYIMNILPANTPLPIKGKIATVATVVPDQDTARIELYEQAGATLSEELDANRLLYEGEVSGIPPAPAGSPIDLTINVEVDGRIDVIAADGTTGAELGLEAFIHGVIDEQELIKQMANVSSIVMDS